MNEKKKPDLDAADQEEPAVEDVTYDLQTPLVRFGEDLKQASRALGRRDARWLIDMYYTLQNKRIRADAQKRTSQEASEPWRLISWVLNSSRRFESAAKTALNEFALNYRVGAWLQSNYGIGPVLSAVCLANFDIRKAPTVGHCWRFAGLDPTLKWLGKEKAKTLMRTLDVDSKLSPDQTEAIREASGQHSHRVREVFDGGYVAPNGKRSEPGKGALVALLSAQPWNGKLHTIMVFRLGECFVRFRNRDECYYGHLYAAQKDALVRANAEGAFAEAAEAKLAEGKIGKKTQAYRHLIEGRLAPAHVHNRARRWTVKLFMSHMHHVMYNDYHGKDPPAPYVFEHPETGDHRHLIRPQNWPGEHGGRPLKELLDQP